MAFGMQDPRLQQMMRPGMGAPPGPVPTQQLGPSGFRSPGMMQPPNPPQQQGMNPLALLGMANAMKGLNAGGGGKSISQMSPSSFDGVIEGMSGLDAQKYLGGLPGQGGGFLDWFKRFF
jgi:hypothetical protein